MNEASTYKPPADQYQATELTCEPPRGQSSMHAYTLPSHGRPRTAPFSMGSTHGQFAYKTL